MKSRAPGYRHKTPSGAAMMVLADNTYLVTMPWQRRLLLGMVSYSSLYPHAAQAWEAALDLTGREETLKKEWRKHRKQPVATRGTWQGLGDAL